MIKVKYKLLSQETGSSGASGCGFIWSRANCALDCLCSIMVLAISAESYFLQISLKVIHRLAPVFSWEWDRESDNAYVLCVQFSLLANHSSHKIVIVSGPELLGETAHCRKITWWYKGLRPVELLSHSQLNDSTCTHGVCGF